MQTKEEGEFFYLLTAKENIWLKKKKKKRKD